MAGEGLGLGFGDTEGPRWQGEHLRKGRSGLRFASQLGSQ